MAIWKEQPTTPKKEVITPAAEPVPRTDFAPRQETQSTYDLPRAKFGHETRESLIAAEIMIEGKIEGAGHVRIAGRFKGDVHVQGNLAIENGAKLTGGVRAGTVTIGGELEGNIDSASRVELLDTGILNGDLKAGSLTVAAGSRMRGKVEFGWDELPAIKSAGSKVESSSAA